MGRNMDYGNQAGKSTRKMAAKRRLITNLILLGVVIVAGVFIFAVQNWQAVGLSGGTVIALLVFLRILPDFLDKPIRKRVKEEKRADRGADAEEVVGDILQTLSNDYFVLHDIPSPYGNIDHIVIGKNSGVFLVETKAHGGKVEVSEAGLLVNGHQPEKDFIAQALKNTYWLREKIEKAIGVKVWIKPIVVFTNAFVPHSKPLKGVTVLNRKFLKAALENPASSNTGLEKVWESKLQIWKTLLAAGEQNTKVEREK